MRHVSTHGQAVTLAPPIAAADLVRRVEATRQDWRRMLWIHAVLRAALAILVGAGVSALADWLWVLETPTRLGVWIVGIIVFLLLAARWRLASQAAASPQRAAAEIENAFPDLGQRVCTTLEYAAPTPTTMPAWPSLVTALSRETSERTRGIDFQQVVPWRSLLRPAAALAGLVLVSLILLAASPAARIAAARLFFVPVHYTQLAVEPGNHEVKAGTDVAVRAIVSGRPVRRVELLHRKADSQQDWTAVSLLPEPKPGESAAATVTGTLEKTLHDCQENLEYRVVAGPVASDIFRLNVLHPLILKSFHAQIEPPAYTRQKPSVVEQTIGDAGTIQDLRVIEGSRVRLQFTLDRAPQTAELRLTATAADASSPATTETLPLTQAESDPSLGWHLASVTRELEAELRAKAADGMELEPQKFRIRVRLDRQPTVRFVRPDEQLEVTPSTEIPMEVASSDDFGLSQVGIVYQIGSGPKKTLHLDKLAEQPVTLATLATLYLEEHPLTFQDAVSYHAFAEDNYPGGPHRVTTDLRFIDIRPYKRSFQVLKTGGT